MHARMNDTLSHMSKRQGHRAKRTALSRVSQLFGHASACKPSSATDTSLCQAVAAPVQTSLDSVTATKVTIVLSRRVDFGDRIAIVGETDALGCWQPCNGVLLQWNEGDVWSGEVCLQPGMHEFKCVTVKSNGGMEWENGSNRVIQVPADAGGALLARCEWSATQYTSLTVTPDVDAVAPDTATAAATAAAAGSSDNSLFHSVSDASLWSAESADGATAVATVSCSPKSTAQQQHTAHKSANADLAPAGASDDGSGSACSDVAYIAGHGMLDTNKQDSVVSQQSQLIPRGSYTNLGPAVSSEDLSVYTYNTYIDNSSSSSVSGSVSNELSFSTDPRQPLTSASLAAAAAAAAAAAVRGSGSSTEDYSITDSVLEAIEEAETVAELQQLSIDPMNISPSPFSGKPSAVNMLSPLSTTSTRPLHYAAAAGSSMMSFSAYSSMEVSELVGAEEFGAVVLSSEDGLAEAVAAATAHDDEAGAALADAAAEAVADDNQISQILEDPLAFEQLMAVEPALLAAQQQQIVQQQVQSSADAPKQGARRADQNKDHGSVFLAAAAAARHSGRDDAQDILSAAADVCALGDDVDAAALLPPEDTLPPTALSKFVELPSSEIEVAGPEQAVADLLLLDGSVDQAADDQAATAGKLPLPAASGISTSSTVTGASSFSSSSSSFTKDDLPCLGLTVTVPSPAEKAAETAAQMHAANADAAAAVAAAKPAYGRGDDLLLEPPVAQEGLRLIASGHMIPHVDKTHTGGEDAFFISPAGHGAVGVSDGVSAWAEDGIDPGEYSRTLVQYCSEAFEERIMAAARAANKGSFLAKFDPRAVLRYAQQCTCKPGSATVVLAALQPGGKLHVANLGDCGVKVVRDGKIVYETQPQQHDFNLPYQLSHPRLFPDTDTADSADRYTWDVQEGDVIVAASDGLFDNLWDDELLNLLPQGLLGAPAPLDSVYSLSSMDSLGRSAGKKLLRSRSFAALTRSSSTASVSGGAGSGSSSAVLSSASSTSQPLPTGAAASTGAGGGTAMTRSRSTSQLASWGAKQLRSWGKSKSGKASAVAAAAGYSLAEDGVFAEAAVAAGNAPQRPATPAEVSAADVARAAELLAAAAAAHAADKEYKSPWSVAAGKAYGLLARLFAKGGKMDDITCVVAVVQDAAKAKAIAEGGGCDRSSTASSSVGINSDEGASPVSL